MNDKGDGEYFNVHIGNKTLYDKTCIVIKHLVNRTMWIVDILCVHRNVLNA